jgi:hypothetical protein
MGPGSRRITKWRNTIQLCFRVSRPHYTHTLIETTFCTGCIVIFEMLFAPKFSLELIVLTHGVNHPIVIVIGPTSRLIWGYHIISSLDINGRQYLPPSPSSSPYHYLPPSRISHLMNQWYPCLRKRNLFNYMAFWAYRRKIRDRKSRAVRRSIESQDTAQ